MYGDNEKKDFRVDSDKDGKTDIWKVKTSDIVISTSGASGKKRDIRIEEKKNGELINVEAEEKNGKLSVISVARSPLVPISHLGKKEYEKLAEECGILTNDRMAQFSSELNSSILRKKMTRLWAANCSKIEGFDDFQEKIQDAFVSTVKLDGGRKNPLLNCLESAKEQAGVDRKAEVSVLILQAKDKISDFYQDKLPQDMLSCAQKDQDSIVMIPGSEHLGINIKDGSGFSNGGLRHSFLTSFLSGMGLKTKEASEIANLCIKGDLQGSSEAILRACGGGKKQFDKENMVKAGDAYGTKIASNKELAAINKKLAETKIEIPSAEETSPRALAAIERTQGPEAAATVARAQSSSLMNAANTVMGAVSTPAIAQTRGLASTSSATPTKINGPNLGKSVVGTKVPSSKIAARGIASDERIVEEIDLTKGRQVSGNTKSRSAQNQARLPANVNEKAAAAGSNEMDSGSDGSSSGGGSDLGRVGSSGGSNFSPSSSSPDAPINARTANSGSRSPSNSAAPAREEVVSFFKNAEYVQAKRKLRDPGFLKVLKENSITVMDLAGNSFGAPRGSTIFLDQGDRFVRQK